MTLAKHFPTNPCIGRRSRAQLARMKPQGKALSTKVRRSAPACIRPNQTRFIGFGLAPGAMQIACAGKA